MNNSHAIGCDDYQIPGGHERPKLTPEPGIDVKDYIQFRNKKKQCTKVIG